MFSLICAWINGWVDNRKAGDLRRHRAHYGVSVMWGWPADFPHEGQKCGNHFHVMMASCSLHFTHWGRVTHICVGYLTIIGSDNGLSPVRRQAITWTNVGILLIGPLGTNFSEMLIEIHTFSFKKIHLKMSSGKWRPFCLGLNVLITLSENYRMIRWNVCDQHVFVPCHDLCITHTCFPRYCYVSALGKSENKAQTCALKRYQFIRMPDTHK